MGFCLLVGWLCLFLLFFFLIDLLLMNILVDVSVARIARVALGIENFFNYSLFFFSFLLLTVSNVLVFWFFYV